MVFTDLNDFEKILSERDIDRAIGYIKTLEREKSANTLNRSYMMLSANKIRHLNKLDSLKCDNVIVNLEDGVSKEEKEIARYMAAIFISNLKESSSKIIVRVNPIGEGGEEDIALINTIKPDAIRVAKIKTVDDAKKACSLIDDDIEIHFSIETKEAFNKIVSLRTDKRITTFSLGIFDLLADMGIPHSTLKYDNPSIGYILGKFLIDCRSIGVNPVSFTYQEYKKLESFRHWCKIEKEMGYRSKSCISPKQAEIANEIFGISDAERERAEYIIRRFEEMQKNEITGFSDEKYGFIDEPIYKGAKKTVNG